MLHPSARAAGTGARAGVWERRCPAGTACRFACPLLGSALLQQGPTSGRAPPPTSVVCLRIYYDAIAFPPHLGLLPFPLIWAFSLFSATAAHLRPPGTRPSMSAAPLMAWLGGGCLCVLCCPPSFLSFSPLFPLSLLSLPYDNGSRGRRRAARAQHNISSGELPWPTAADSYVSLPHTPPRRHERSLCRAFFRASSLASRARVARPANVCPRFPLSRDIPPSPARAEWLARCGGRSCACNVWARCGSRWRRPVSPLTGRQAAATPMFVPGTAVRLPP